MKKKNLLQDWEIVQQEYYEQFNRSEVEEKYSDWFGNSIEHYPYMEKSQMIEELIEDELRHRQDDTIEELKETLTETIEELHTMTAYKKWLIQTAEKIDGDLQTSVAALLLIDLQSQKEITFDLMNEMSIDKMIYSDEVILKVANKIIKQINN
jgi:uncharacterized coiled-coil protein SlyX